MEWTTELPKHDGYYRLRIEEVCGASWESDVHVALDGGFTAECPQGHIVPLSDIIRGGTVSRICWAEVDEPVDGLTEDA